MKILLRIALLTFCATGGLMLAVHLATHRSADASVPLSPPQDAVVQASPTSNGPSTFGPHAEPPRAAAPKLETVRPRTANEFTNDGPAGFRRPMESVRVAQLPSGTSGSADATVEKLLGQIIQNQTNLPINSGTNGQNFSAELIMKVLNQNEQTMKAYETLHSQLNGARQTTAAPNAGPALSAPTTPAAIAAPAPAKLVEQLPAAETTPAADESSRETPAPAPAIRSEIVDVPGAIAAEGDGKLTINAREVDVRVLLEQLAEQAGLNILAGASVSGTMSLNMQHVGVEQALDAILKATGFTAKYDGGFVYVGTAEDFAAMEKAQDRIGTRVYRPNYINSKELSTVLTPLLTPSTGKISVTTPSGVGIAVDNTAAGGDSMSQQDALVIQDYESVLAQIDLVIKDLDRRPAQVSIEAMIVSVTLNDDNNYGVDFQLLRDQQHVRLGWGSPRQAPLAGGGKFDPVTGAPLGQFAFDTGGLKFAFLDDSLGVFINALETVGDANVIASPKLLCLNKQKAEILIGQKLGYISTTVTQNFSTQNVEFLDVGAQLRLRPFISSDGLIRMEVHPELSEGEVVVTGGFTLPNKTLTEVTTNVMCPDGCTVILGGLMRENLRSNSTQVPLLGSLPAVGPLFRHKTESVERVEIIILLTPRIVYDGDNAAEGSLYRGDMEKMENAKYHRMSPIGKAHLGRDYNDRARAALADGNRTLATRYARLAVHYDPLNRDAVRTLHDLGSQGGAAPIPQGLAVETVVGEDGEPVLDGEMPSWMLEELGRDGGIPPPDHPRDPGMPGRSFDAVRPKVFHDEQKQ